MIVIKNLENTMIKMYVKEVLEHFPRSMEHNTRFKGKYKPMHQPIVMNDDIDNDLELLIAKEKGEDQYTRILVEGLELLDEDNETTTEVAPRAMLIHTANSDGSMSGISTTSKSTTGTVHWGSSVEGKERTAESIKNVELEKIQNSWIKYDIKEEEVQNWMRENIKDKEDPRLKMDMI